MVTVPKTVTDRYVLQERWRSRAAQLAITLSGGRARLTILLVAILFCLWQLYVFAWVPLSAETALPEGIAPVKPELDMTTLTKIRDARAARLQHKPNLFADAEQYFVLSSVTSSPPAGQAGTPSPKP